MLKPVIENQNPGVMLFDGFSRPGRPVRIDDHRAILARLGQQGRFIRKRTRMGLIPPRQDRAANSLLRQRIGKPDHQRGFAGSACSQVADADNRHRYSMHRQDVPVIKPHPRTVRQRQHAQQPPHRRGLPSLGRT